MADPTRADAARADAALPTIRVAAVALIRHRHVLMVTARGRDVIYMPGGKIDRGENAPDAAIREAREEISVELDASSVAPLFTVTVQAHGEPAGLLRSRCRCSRRRHPTSRGHPPRSTRCTG